MPRQEFEAWACVAEQATACFARLLLFFSSWYHHVLKKGAGQRPEVTDDENKGLGRKWGSEADQDERSNNDGSIASESASMDDLPGMSPGLSDPDDSEAEEKAAGIEGGGSGILGYSLFSADKVARSGHESTNDWMVYATKGQRAMEFSQHEHSHPTKSKGDGSRPPKKMSLTATLSALLLAEENRMGRGQTTQHHDATFKVRPAITVWSREPMHLRPINIQDNGGDSKARSAGQRAVGVDIEWESLHDSERDSGSREASSTSPSVHHEPCKDHLSHHSIRLATHVQNRCCNGHSVGLHYPSTGGSVCLSGTVNLESRGPSSLSARSTENSDTKRCQTSAR